MTEQPGPYDDVKCYFCGKSSKDGVKYTAGYLRSEVIGGKLYDACEQCARKEPKEKT